MYIPYIRHEVCRADKDAVRTIYSCDAVHYVVGGHGYFNGRRLGAGEGFVCRKGQAAKYRPDRSDPWEYYWIRTEGDDTDKFFDLIASDDDGVFRHNLACELKSLCELMHATDRPGCESLKSGAFVEIVMKLHSPGNSEKLTAAERYTVRTKQMIEGNLCGSLRISDIAKALHLNRCYLRNVFYECEGMSPCAYRRKKRMDYAAKLLSGTEYPIGIIADSVGYTDQLQFSREFKKSFGISPSNYRKSHRCD